MNTQLVKKTMTTRNHRMRVNMNGLRARAAGHRGYRARIRGLGVEVQSVLCTGWSVQVDGPVCDVLMCSGLPYIVLAGSEVLGRRGALAKQKQASLQHDACRAAGKRSRIVHTFQTHAPHHASALVLPDVHVQQVVPPEDPHLQAVMECEWHVLAWQSIATYLDLSTCVYVPTCHDEVQD